MLLHAAIRQGGDLVASTAAWERIERVFASTWNVGGIMPSDDLDLDDWLDTRDNFYDIYVIGFQEIVPLNARNVLGPKKSCISAKWKSLIAAALNKNRVIERADSQQASTDNSAMESSAQAEYFSCIMSKQMVGIFTSVWARSSLKSFIHHLDVSSIGSGIMGCLGNKGSVSIRFVLQETKLLFRLLSPGFRWQRRGCAAEEFGCRGYTCKDEFCKTYLVFLLNESEGVSQLRICQVVLLGDLNYRISLEETETRSLVKAKNWAILLENDQLLFEFSRGRHFEGWQEGSITFSPTYKYHPNSDQYYWCFDGVIVFCGMAKGLKQVQYETCNYRLSDHRPVRAVFHAECDVSEGTQK
ncbi:hypothetical protein PR202_gb22718 [Eleusine coracana subsp. coracana]|uniref:Inositol polyphosphate-related phosphatase domain-containing protein n=1 Tax=Eleusine coracana subsp. coracana TaxID=191504 RepID=A0AAV5FIG3_ELECO|nr:hypothetical protein PR202_gb22718 [Eleusine coracana subsp. coracana]